MPKKEQAEGRDESSQLRPPGKFPRCGHEVKGQDTLGRRLKSKKRFLTLGLGVRRSWGPWSGSSLGILEKHHGTVCVW